MDIRVVLIMLAEAVFAFFLLYRSKLLSSKKYLAAAIVLIVAAMAVRFRALDHLTNDYNLFLSAWVDFFRTNGGFSAMKYSVGNYNIPYLYFLALFSYSSISDLYLIKLLSVFFDIVLAWAVMLLVSKLSKDPKRQLFAFFAVLFLPTVFLNGAYWAQCDSIYVALAALGIHLALDDRPVLSMVFIALSFGFKLQAVFVMPVYAILWMHKKFNWKHFLVFPLSYVVLVLPAVLLGRPFIETITLYLSQTDSIGTGLNYNSSSIFSIIKNVSNPESATSMAIIAAFVFMLAVLAIALINRKQLSSKSILFAAALLAVGIPFLLPRMHDRYFFAADILTLVLAISYFKTAPIAILVQFASMAGYLAYLTGRFVIKLQYGGLAMMFAFALLLICYLASLFSDKKNNRQILS